LKIWPNSTIDAPYLRHCCCRFQSAREVSKLSAIDHQDILNLMQKISATGLDIVKTENLYTYDGQIGFTLAQGQ
jgi:isocitrate dehydrogenase